MIDLRKMNDLLVAAVLLALMLQGPSITDAAADADSVTIKAAVSKALPLIEKSSAAYLEQRTCFSCHHQAMSMLVLVEARRHGFTIDEKNLQNQIQRTRQHLENGKSRYESGKGTGGQADTAGHALHALEAVDAKPDVVTAAVVKYLLERDNDRNHWRTTGRRPPTQASPITTTYLAMRGINNFATAEERKLVDLRKEKTLKWLLDAKAKDTEDHVSRLQALAYLRAENASIRDAVEKLIKLQRKDGGWAQLPDLQSDAYATATVLVALNRAGELKTSDVIYQRGLNFLIDSQKEDGSWHVKTRSRPIQRYFESGFPHGKDQFISMSATCWSTLALIAACPEPTR